MDVYMDRSTLGRKKEEMMLCLKVPLNIAKLFLLCPSANRIEAKAFYSFHQSRAIGKDR